MADDKGKSSPSNKDAFEELVAIVFILLVLGAIVTRITVFLGDNPAVGQTFSFESFSDYFKRTFLPTLSVISYVLSVVFAFGIAWTLKKLTVLNKEIDSRYGETVEYASGETIGQPAEQNHKWERVLEHLGSQNPNDWKFAILEADIMLADLLEKLQYRGETVAEKLKAVEQSDFRTLEAAWEAHKVRNTIAHEGADFVLTDREARRIIDLYRSVFEEFHII